MDAFSLLAKYLSDVGLSTLFNIDSQGNPSGWLWDQIQNGVDSREQLLVQLEQTPEFRQRFKIIFDMRKKAANGENVSIPNVQDVLEYEQQYRNVMSQAGVPSWFYDQPKDAQDAMRRNLTIEQISNRIDVSYGIINQMPVEVRDTFAAYFGDATDASLVAAVLDPQKTLDNLEKATRAAVAGGFARRQGLDITKEQAQEYASLGRSTQQAQADIAQAAQLQPLATTQIGEAPMDGTAQDIAFKAGALGQVDVQTQLENRLSTRRAGQAQSAGGALTSSQGVVGAGSAR